MKKGKERHIDSIILNWNYARAMNNIIVTNAQFIMRRQWYNHLENNPNLLWDCAKLFKKLITKQGLTTDETHVLDILMDIDDHLMRLSDICYKSDVTKCISYYRRFGL